MYFLTYTLPLPYGPFQYFLYEYEVVVDKIYINSKGTMYAYAVWSKSKCARGNRT